MAVQEKKIGVASESKYICLGMTDMQAVNFSKKPLDSSVKKIVQRPARPLLGRLVPAIDAYQLSQTLD